MLLRLAAAALAALAVAALGANSFCRSSAFAGPAVLQSRRVLSSSSGSALRGAAGFEAPRASPQASGSFAGCLATAIGAAAAVAVARVVARMAHMSEKQMGYRIKGAPGRPGSPTTWTPKIRWCKRFKKRIKIRRKTMGTCARPRVAVFKSLQHMHVNVVDDTIGSGVTLLTLTTKQKPILEQIRQVQNCEEGEEITNLIFSAEILGKELAKQCLEKGITMITYDRGGFKYAGRVQALAEAARSGGLQF
mmetsp:Transcript_124424/g.311107  ORF Transcript_124424/g.311107 Transcript_124424/m.311107 type:complete len:249 (+) Transcript_124424:77-823(+)